MHTIALTPTSPAIDKGPACANGLATDQRGQARNQGINCDAGAYEISKITIDKTVVGSQAVDSTFTITSTQPGCTATPSTATITGTATVAVTVKDITNNNATACSYTVTETGTVPAGYTATSTTATVSPGQTALFTNTQDPADATIIIDKTVVGSQAVDSTFTITSTQPGCTATPSTATITGTATVAVTVKDITNNNATACSYTVTETGTVPAGYTATSTTATVSPGQTALFTNTQDPADATIIIDKTVVGSQAVDSTFTITSTQPGCTATPSTATITGTATVAVTVKDITNNATACSYTVTETGTVPAGYTPDQAVHTATPGSTVTITNTQDPSSSTVPGERLTLVAGITNAARLFAVDPIACGATFTGTISATAGITGPYTLTYALTGPATIDLGSFTVAEAGEYTAPAGFPDYAKVPDDIYTVTFAVVAATGHTANGVFTALITDNCDSNNTYQATTVVPVLAAAVPAAAGPTELALSGATTTPTIALALALALIGAGFSLLGTLRRNRNRT